MLYVSLLLAACSGGATTQTTQQSAAGGGAQPIVVPTMPPARFTPVPQQIAAGSSLTQTTTVTQTTAEPAATVDEQVLQRGATIFVNRKCSECHGEQAEGITDKGTTLAGTQLTLSEFTTVLRTGKNGEIGPEHIFGPSAISPGGVEALHKWLQSLSTP